MDGNKKDQIQSHQKFQQLNQKQLKIHIEQKDRKRNLITDRELVERLFKMFQIKSDHPIIPQ